MFRGRVLSVVRRIPPGRVATYGDIAAAAGNGRASRAVGNIMRDCKSHDVPCHRVVAAGGRLGGYGGNLELKRALLRAEGVVVIGNAIRNFKARRWAGPADAARLRRHKPVRRSAKRQEPAAPKRREPNVAAARRTATRTRRGDV